MSLQTHSSHRRQFGWGCLFVSFGLWALISICWVADWDWASALTIFPYWSWATVGATAAFTALRLRCSQWHGWLSVILWTVSTLYFSDNLLPFLRLASTPKQSPAKHLCVVTLNCAGSSAAVRQVLSFKPDIVLLQEIPRATNILHEIANDLFGESGAVVVGFDCAILARGKLARTHENQPPQWVQAELTLDSGIQVKVTSLRLVPPVARMDLWNPNAWKATAANRRLRRDQLQLLARSNSEPSAQIVGGDFNATANDQLFRLLSGYNDAHKVAGRGLGNTMLNSFPIARPDRIWARELDVAIAQTFKAIDSDHRLVVAVLELPTR